LRFSGSKAGWIEEERIWVPETAPLPGKTPLELVTGEPRNPLNADKDTLGALENAELACAERSGSS
jgi:hypothetical protein